MRKVNAYNKNEIVSRLIDLSEKNQTDSKHYEHLFNRLQYLKGEKLNLREIRLSHYKEKAKEIRNENDLLNLQKVAIEADKKLLLAIKKQTKKVKQNFSVVEKPNTPIQEKNSLKKEKYVEKQKRRTKFRERKFDNNFKKNDKEKNKRKK